MPTESVTLVSEGKEEEGEDIPSSRALLAQAVQIIERLRFVFSHILRETKYHISHIICYITYFVVSTL